MPVDHTFKINDVVRKKLARPTFTKGYKQIWSNRTYTIKNISGVHGILNNDDRVRLDDLQKIIKEFDQEASAVEKVEKEVKIEKIIKHKEGLDKDNIIESRLRKK